MKNKISESLNQELRSVTVRPELRTRILSSVRNERYRRRQRRFRTLSAVAAVLVITLAIVGGIKFIRKPVPDKKVSNGNYTSVWIDETERVYHAKSNCVNHKMSVVSLNEARARGFTACPRCIHVISTPQPTEAPTVEPTSAPTVEPTVEPTPEPTSASEDVDYDVACYMTDGGKWYHSAQNCQNMQGAYLTTVRDALENGKSACPVCWGQEVVWMTDGGVCYHNAEHCQNMMSAKQVARSSAEEAGKQRCGYCFVEPDDSAWMEMIGNGIYVQIHAAQADGRVFLYLTNDIYATALYGDAVETGLEDADSIATELESISGNRLNPLIVTYAAESIAAGNQIGVRAICYQIDEIHAYDADGEIEVAEVQTYMESDSETGLLCIAETEDARIPTRVSAEISVYGVSYYLDAGGNWHALETKYAVNLLTEAEYMVESAETEDVEAPDAEENAELAVATYYLYITGADDAADAINLETSVRDLVHASYSTLESCIIDGYGYESESYSIVLLSTTDAYAETLFEQLYQDNTGSDLIQFVLQNEGTAQMRTVILESPISEEVLDEIARNVQLALTGTANVNPPAGSAERASVKTKGGEKESSVSGVIESSDNENP